MENQEQQPMKVMAVELCAAMGKMYSTAEQFKHRMPSTYFHRERTMIEVADFALAQLEAARKIDVDAHEKNLPALAMNARIHEHITALMAAIEMPDGWSERDPSSRARIPRTIRHAAGWRTDLLKHCRISDSFEQATASYEKNKKAYLEYREAALRDAEQRAGQKEREEAAKLAQRMADKELVAIITRYDLPMESEWGDVLEAIRGRDQRLDLAVAMEDVRGDWNEGCGAVEDALSRFTIRDNEDKDIANDVLGCTRDFEDGRVFRDTTWSYDALYASVADGQLVADVQLARQHARSE